MPVDEISEKTYSFSATHTQWAKRHSEHHLKSILKMKVKWLRSGSSLNEDPWKMFRSGNLVYLEEAYLCHRERGECIFMKGFKKELTRQKKTFNNSRQAPSAFKSFLLFCPNNNRNRLSKGSGGRNPVAWDIKNQMVQSPRKYSCGINPSLGESKGTRPAEKKDLLFLGLVLTFLALLVLSGRCVLTCIRVGHPGIGHLFCCLQVSRVYQVYFLPLRECCVPWVLDAPPAQWFCICFC